LRSLSRNIRSQVERKGFSEENDFQPGVVSIVEVRAIGEHLNADPCRALGLK
jgi:hypothetical protein